MLKGLSSGLLWGLDTVLIGIILSVITGSPRLILFAPLIATFFHDTFSGIWLTFYAGYHTEIKSIPQKLKSKSGIAVIVASFIGGPAGMTAYVFAISLIGPGMTSVISAFFPALGAVMAHFFLKNKLNGEQWLALFISISAIIVISMPSNKDGTMVSLSLTGIICAIICVICWASESVLCSYAMGMKNGVSEIQAMCIRQWTSSSVYLIFILPITGSIGLLPGFVSKANIYLLVLASIFGAISHLHFYQSIHKIGPPKAMSLNITYTAWAIGFAFIFTGESPDFVRLIAAVIVVVASLITAGAFSFLEISKALIKRLKSNVV